MMNKNSYNTKLRNRTGHFTENEKRRLNEALLVYSQALSYDTEDYSWLFDSSNPPPDSLWTYLQEATPQRKVQSVKLYILRKFNSRNYKGQWTPEEEEKLKVLYNKKDYNWQEIADKIGRTVHNVRDKWKELNGKESTTDPLFWTLERTLKLIQLVGQQQKVQLISEDNWKSIYNNIDIEKMMERERKLKPKKSPKSIQNYIVKKVIHDYLSVSLTTTYRFKGIKWEKISKQIEPPVSYDFCKNKWKMLFTYDRDKERKRKVKELKKFISLALSCSEKINDTYRFDLLKKSLDFRKFKEIISFLEKIKRKDIMVGEFLIELKNYLEVAPLYRIRR